MNRLLILLTITVAPGLLAADTPAAPGSVPPLAAEFVQAPADADTVAWIRLADAGERLDEVPYHWLGRGELKFTFDVQPKPGHALLLRWGSKNDVRRATLVVNGRRFKLEAGGYQGFRWLRVPLPEDLKGTQYEMALQAGGTGAAFLAEARLLAAGAAPSSRDLRQTSHQARLLSVVAPAAAERREAFPEMRLIWDRDPASASDPNPPPSAALFRQAEKNARLANEALYRSRRFIDGWLAYADPATGLIPRNLSDSRTFWNGRDAAADNYAFMVLTAAITDRPLLEGRMSEMLRTERRVTARLGCLTDDYSFPIQSWRRTQFDLDATIFDSAEYVKDGLLSITEWLGPSPWSERMVGLVDDIWKHAPVDTPFGKIPTRNFEVNGDLLQACARLYWFTGQRKYLDWAVRLGDFFLLSTNHPTRHAQQLRLQDHGGEVVNGLTELYVIASRALPEKHQAYRQPIHEMLDAILAKGANAEGLLYSWFNPQTGEHSAGLCDTWGYIYDGFYTVHLVDGTPAYREAVRKALANLKGKYEGACWADKSFDGYADALEGALNLLQREPVPPAAEWIDAQIRLMWALQHADGVIGSWHGDGNFARTSLLYALWKTQGVTVQPWRADVRFGAVRSEDGQVHLSFLADQAWEGRVVFDRPRHRDYLRLPLDYPRINQFPEWFVTRRGETYSHQDLGTGRSTTWSAGELQRGIGLALKPGTETRWIMGRKP